jgi:hypothetical protein
MDILKTACQGGTLWISYILSTVRRISPEPPGLQQRDVDEDCMLISSIKCVAVPDEVKIAANSVQRDRPMAQAQEEANRTIAIAREKRPAIRAGCYRSTSPG